MTYRRVMVLSRWKALGMLGLLVCILWLGTVFLWHVLVPVTSDLSNWHPTVVLDPGHGGVDGGANIGEELMEKNITLTLALTVRDLLVAKGVEVGLTREGDRDVAGPGPAKGRHRRDLLARLQMVRQGKVAVSIHVNSVQDPQQQGALIFYGKDNEQGRMLAASILEEVQKVQQLNHPAPVPRTNLLILREADNPVVILEIGFISNPIDRAKLQDPAFLQQMAASIATGIVNYLLTNGDKNMWGYWQGKGLPCGKEPV